MCKASFSIHVKASKSLLIIFKFYSIGLSFTFYINKIQAIAKIWMVKYLFDRFLPAFLLCLVFRMHFQSLKFSFIALKRKDNQQNQFLVLFSFAQNIFIRWKRLFKDDFLNSYLLRIIPNQLCKRMKWKTTRNSLTC